MANVLETDNGIIIILRDRGGTAPDTSTPTALVQDDAPSLVGAVAPVATAPTAGQGFTLDEAGKLPLSVRQLQVGYSLAYAELTSDAAVAATTEATATTIVTAASVTVDGATAVEVKFYSYRVDKGTTSTTLVLYDAVGTAAAASIGLIGVCTATQQPVTVQRFYTPSVGVHTYSVRAFVDAGTGNVRAAAGGSGAGMPAYLRITRA